MKQDNLGFFYGLIFAIVLSSLTAITCLELVKYASSLRNFPVKQYNFKKVKAAFLERKK